MAEDMMSFSATAHAPQKSPQLSFLAGIWNAAVTVELSSVSSLTKGPITSVQHGATHSEPPTQPQPLVRQQGD